MNELVKALQSRIDDLERSAASFERVRTLLSYEVDYWRSRALGVENTHPTAVENRAAAKAIMDKLEVVCPRC